MSYPTLLFWPALLWWYQSTDEAGVLADSIVIGYFVAIAVATAAIAGTFKDVLVLVRELRSAGTTPPPFALRLGCHLVAVAACMGIGMFATALQIAYVAILETAIEVSYDPA